MKKLLFFSILYLLFQALSAQPEDKKLGKITFLMVDGEYEEAVKKTEKLREDSEYRKNGWMYYYMSQAYFEIAGMPELAEDYPKALKNSIKAAYKLAKYRDKSNENLKVWQDAQGFISALKDSVITVSEIYYDTENYRKSAYYLKKATRFSPDDYGLWLMKGVYEIKSRNIGEGIKSIIFSMDSLNPEYIPYDVSTWTLIDALDEYVLIVQSGEYEKYFQSYKYNPGQKEIDRAMELKRIFMKLVEEEEVIDKDARKKESQTIYKTFRSDDGEDEDEDDDE